LALGRKANIENMGLEKANIRVNFGKILVDEMERTTTENIFAIGDVSTQIKEHGLKDGTAIFFRYQKNEPTYFSGIIISSNDGKYDIRCTENGYQGKIFRDIEDKHIQYRSHELPELTPVAIQAATYLVRRIFAKGKTKMQYKLIPTTIFSTPEYGTIGLTTEEAEREEKEGGIGKENVEVWWSRYGPIEQTPCHPHYCTSRSNLLHGKNLWARQYAEKNKIWWPDTGFDENDYSTVIYDNGEIKIDAIVTNHYQNEHNDWVYDLETDNGKKYNGIYPKYLELRGEAITFRYERYIKSNHLAKLIVDKRNGKIIGFHFIGNNASEITQGFALGLLLGATKDQFDCLTGIHPTAAEEFTVLNITRSSQKNFLKQEGCGGGSC
jgi:Pyruvate/2-oxoglutarate dehydrogenase complex, dihydrolipoamide dehydrogenase (E3) component, and related enzymes